MAVQFSMKNPNPKKTRLEMECCCLLVIYRSLEINKSINQSHEREESLWVIESSVIQSVIFSFSCSSRLSSRGAARSVVPAILLRFHPAVVTFLTHARTMIPSQRYDVSL
jgi:hypothetical protein